FCEEYYGGGIVPPTHLPEAYVTSSKNRFTLLILNRPQTCQRAQSISPVYGKPGFDTRRNGVRLKEEQVAKTALRGACAWCRLKDPPSRKPLTRSSPAPARKPSRKS